LGKFWKEFQTFHEGLTDLQINLTVKDIVIGIPTKECHLLNHLFNNIWEVISEGMLKEKRTSKYSRVLAKS